MLRAGLEHVALLQVRSMLRWGISWFLQLQTDLHPGIDIIANFNTAIQVDDDGSRPDALIRDRRETPRARAAVESKRCRSLAPRP